MTRRLVQDTAAREDLVEIWSYGCLTWGVVRADEYLLDLEDALTTLLRFPGAARPRPELRPDYWSKHVGQHVVYYTFDDEELRVRRVLHVSMDVDPLP